MGAAQSTMPMAKANVLGPVCHWFGDRVSIEGAAWGGPWLAAMYPWRSSDDCA